MTGSVDKIEEIFLSVLRGVMQADRACLYGYSALALKIHIIEQLILHLPRADRARSLEQTICERALAVVYMRYYRKITNMAEML